MENFTHYTQCQYQGLKPMLKWILKRYVMDFPLYSSFSLKSKPFETILKFSFNIVLVTLYLRINVTKIVLHV